ncbi:glycosyltransferase family 4 protein [Clostridiaceae bacterium UIB06]|nr:glycosyltransferase family 4 protein [Clostridiaceae bacterium UIB06]
MFTIKVLQIISGNDNGGGGNHVLNLSFYSKDKFECIIGCIGPGDLYKRGKSLGISMAQFGSKAAYDGSILKYVEENNIDIINFHGAKAFFMHCFLKHKLQALSVATIHSNYKKDFLNNKFKQIFFTPLSILGLKSFKYYICVSNYISNLLKEDNFKGKRFIVNNGVDYDAINVVKNRETIRKMYGLHEKDFVYISVARMHPIKNHSGLIQAFNQLRKERERAKLILVGDGELEEEIKNQIKTLNLEKDIILTGFTDRPIDIVNAADVSILTSFSEGGSPPLVVLESAAVKKAFICSRVGDIEETINDQRGFIVNPNSVQDIYEKMMKAYDRREDLGTMGESLYQFVKDAYSMDSFCNKYYSAYQEILLRK